jgi:hypothetical protein
MDTNEVINLAIKPNQVIEIEYFNGNIDGLNNLTFKLDCNGITITSLDDECNEFDVKTITINQLLALANKKFDRIL